MDVRAMKHAGMTFVEIGEQTGYHPATIAKWWRDGDPPPARTVAVDDRVIDPVWADRLTALLVGNPLLLATSLFEVISAEGFSGSYPTVARWVREQRGPRFRRADAASVPIETAPGEEAQFDFSDCSAWSQRVGLGPVLWCFGMILCWSRWRIWWFTTSVDREHTFEGIARFFDAVGGVPQVCRTDRMGALGMSQGKRFKLHPPTIEFARHHGVEIKACQAGDAKRKGKIERPFRDLGESFLEELVVTGVPADIDALNRSARGWIDERVHRRVHRTTHALPADRFEAEGDFLGAMPRQRFDTDYVETRRVHRALPFIEWQRVRYSVPPACLGQLVEVRHAVDSDVLTVRAAGRLVATHRIVTDGRDEIWDPEHRRVAEAAALASTRPRHLHIVAPPPTGTTAAGVGRLELPGGDFDVAAPDLAARYDHRDPA
ncbi:MAG: IS21 family transposase [Acidimicrobiia bacterium]